MYIGKTPIVGNFQKCDALTASATADYTLQVGSTNVVPESVNHMIVSLNGVIQAPTTAYTVSGAVLSFASALTSNDTIDFVILLGNVLDIGTPSDDTVATAKIVADAVTEAKIADDAVESEHLNDNVISGQTALGAVPADTDELLISDAGTIKRVDYSYLKSTNTPYFLIAKSGDQDISNNTVTTVAFNSEHYDSGSGFDTSTYMYTIPTGTGGKWIFYFKILFEGTDEFLTRAQLVRNGTGDQKRFDIYKDPTQNTVQGMCLQQAGDDQAYYISIYHAEGDTQTIDGGGATFCEFSGFRLAD